MRSSLGSLVLLAATGSAPQPVPAEVVRYLTGDPRDVSPRLFGPAHDLAGGGADVDAALQWLIDEVRGCTSCATRVDVVVLRASGADGYNAPVFALHGVDSVETLVITTRADAERTDVEATVRNAEVVFFAGGDQCDYVRLFKGSRVERAVEYVYAKWGGVGGASAGAAIQGPLVYDACQGSVLSREALADPYHPFVSFSYDFLDWAFFHGALVDTHFFQRDRMGRLLAFLARQLRDGRTGAAWGIGVDEATSVVADFDGRVQVMGAGYAYFVLADHLPEVCEPRRPLSYFGFKVWRVGAGGRFDLKYRPSSGYYRVNVERGVVTRDPY